ncbi:uncharacterized protein CcaverHIS019_0504880 [Cutaneotrichosporon cavernicola]|uniref:Uncharacterized protein n=1 Tax=Cutaneotrichosporon cavernicola TaxID=279322 RepID=A0AA48L6K2_9TREE|nr:uncharacterized protein CcaverHIS019_0504880 [Cutaneotrichosporon cavernicola]BEI92860.1 hypothetical protein CcaverHIS019_0504880 [Cutaneotrichosporon cavernicola]BEJ00636.1 hypothetical protein CcaverHIS631_0504930 [Cutaneotrichosporon cavernicola]
MTDKVSDNVDAHRELLLSLQAVEYAPATLAEIEKQLETSKTEVAEEKRNIAALEASTKKAFKDWRDTQQRTHKRVWTKIIHPNSHKERLTALENKEEREYVDALAKEQGTKARIEELETQVLDLSTQVSDLKPFVTKHTHLTSQLEQLYSRVFDGPTPDYPEEDEAEKTYQEAIERFDSLQGKITNETRAQELLGTASVRLRKAQEASHNAEKYSQRDMFGGGIMSDLMERSELDDAQRWADKAHMLVMQAQQLQPAIGSFGRTQMPQGNMSDIFFDNPFTDYAFHKKIKTAVGDLQRASLQLADVTRRGQARLDSLLQEGQEAAMFLESSCSGLRQTRREIMERAGGIAPPTYAPKDDVPAYNS